MSLFIFQTVQKFAEPAGDALMDGKSCFKMIHNVWGQNSKFET